MDKNVQTEDVYMEDSIIDKTERLYLRIISGEKTYQDKKVIIEVTDENTGQKTKTETTVKHIPPDIKAMEQWLHTNGRLDTAENTQENSGVILIPERKEEENDECTMEAAEKTETVFRAQ